MTIHNSQLTAYRSGLLKKLYWLTFLGCLLSDSLLAQNTHSSFASNHSRLSKQPNIVIILADDLGYGDVQCYNPNGKILTPNIDRLASQGMRFTDAHSSSAICTPSRYSILTGRYHWRSRKQEGIVEKWEEPLITPERLTIAGLAKQNGYLTAAMGKWHLGWNWPIAEEDRSHFIRFGSFESKSNNPSLKFDATDEDRAAWARTFSRPIKGGPLAVGFDTYFGTDVPNWPPFCFIRDEKTVGIPTEFLKDGLVTINQASFQGPALKDWKLEEILPELQTQAVNFITEQSKTNKPFLLYLPLTSPHTPLAVEAKWKNKSGLNNDYADFVMQTDAVVGKILDAIKQGGIEENTIVIFTSDNGCGNYIGVKDLEARGHYVSGGLRGYKGEVWEGGTRIPFIVRYPGTVKPGTVCDKLVLQADIMRTMADIFGKKLPANAGEDSYSLLPLLKGKNVNVRETAVYCRYDGLQAIRKGPWKLICTDTPRLFNLQQDIAETKDVAADNPKLVSEMLALQKKFIDDGRTTPGAIQRNDVTVKVKFER